MTFLEFIIFGENHFEKLAELMGGEGEFAVFVGSLTVPLHNLWADIGLEYAAEKYPRTILGVTLVAVMQNGLTLLGVSSYWHKVVIGLVILISVSMTAYNRKKEEQVEAEIDV